jgi:ABC-2 type transport system permease protein
MTTHLRLIWDLACKDLRLFLADRRGVVLCFAVPIVLASIFGAAFHRPAGSAVVRLRLLVVDEDDSTASQGVANALCNSKHADASRADRAVALRQLAEGAGVAIVLPRGFAAAARARIEVLHHPSSTLEAHWAEGLATEAVLRAAAADLMVPLALLRPDLDLEHPIDVEHAAVTAAGTLNGGEVVDAYSHSFCGMTVQYLLFWGMDSGLLLLRERRLGIWRRLRAAPVSPGTLLAGRALFTALVALAQVLATIGFGAAFFGVRLTGSLFGFALLAVAAASLSAATGLVVAALGGTEGRARSVAILVILLLSLFGGLWVPSFVLPAWLQQAAKLLPTTWAARGLEGVTWQGMGIAPACRCGTIVLGFAAAFLALAWRHFTRSEQGLTGGKA